MLDNITGKIYQLIDWLEKHARAAEINLEHDDQANAIFTALGIFTSLILAVAFYLWAAPSGISMAPFLLCGALALYLHSFIWLLVHKGEPYSRALLIGLFSLVPLSLFPPAIAPTILVVLDAILLFYMAYKKAPAFLKQPKNIQFIAIFSAFFALVIFAATAGESGDALADLKFHELNLNPDLLFQSAIATMVKNYSAIATGLNGLVRLHYPVLSNYIYAIIAKMLNIKVYEVYGLATFIVFGPLMILSWMRFCSEMTAKAGQSILLIALIFSLIVLAQCFGWQSQGYFTSQGFLIGLILLPGALSALAPIARKDGRNQLRNWFTVWMYLPFLGLAAPAIGLGFFILTIYFLLVRSFYSWGSRLGYLLPTMGLWFVGDYGAGPLKHVNHFQWGAARNALGDDNLIHFILAQFISLILLLPIILYRPFRSLLNRELRIWLEFFFIFAAIAVVGAQFTTPISGYYFICLPLFFAVPVILQLFTTSDFRQGFAPYPAPIVENDRRESVRKTKPFVFHYYRILIAFMFAAGVFYVVRIFPQAYVKTEQIRDSALSARGFDWPYFKLFRLIQEAPDEGYLVYVPRSETPFWLNSEAKGVGAAPCNIPFYLPIATGHPAIFGLPDPGAHCEAANNSEVAKNGEATPFGYDSYEAKEFKDASSGEVADGPALCKVVLAKGFFGYYRVTLNEGVVKERCL